MVTSDLIVEHAKKNEHHLLGYYLALIAIGTVMINFIPYLALL
jgi:hypothetical protein